MVDTIRTPTDLVTNLFQDNQAAGSITPQDARDFIASAFALPPSSNSPISGTTATIGLVDLGCITHFTSATAVTITVPTNASVAVPLWSWYHARQMGAGQLTIAPAGGVTLDNPYGTLTTRAQYCRISMQKVGTNEWVLEGEYS